MDEIIRDKYIQVNLPLTEQDYMTGNGEGVWVLVDLETKHAYDADAEGAGYVGILDNDNALCGFSLGFNQNRGAGPMRGRAV